MNVRMIAAILAHVLYNQFRVLIQSRVVYDRELFNYEEYVSKCLADDRLINKLLLATATVTSGWKSLYGDLYRFNIIISRCLARLYFIFLSSISSY